MTEINHIFLVYITLNLSEIAEILGTIPYEIMTSVPRTPMSRTVLF